MKSQLHYDHTTHCNCIYVVNYVHEHFTDQERKQRGGIIPRAPNHCGCVEKSQRCHKYFLQYSTFATERSQVRSWGLQTSAPGAI